MSIKSIIAGGPVAILAAGGGVLFAQHELHYLLRPSVIETLAGIAAIGGGMVWAKNHKAKGKAEDKAVGQPSVEEQAAAYLAGIRDAQQTLPKAQPAPRDMVIDHTGSVVQRNRVR
jgi:disulfide bond formation protein DsbB